MLKLPQTRTFKLGVVVAILESLSAIALIATSAFLISRASEQPPVLFLMIAIVGVRAFALGRAVFRYVQRLLLHEATFSQVALLRPVVFKRIADLSPGIEVLGHGQGLARITDQVEETQNYPIRVFTPLVQSLAATALTAIVVGIWFPTSSLAVVGIAAVAFATSNFLSASIAARSETIRFDLNNRLRAELVEFIQAAQLLAAYDWDARFAQRISELTREIEVLDKKSAFSLGASSSIFSFLGVVAAATAGYLAAPALQNIPGHLLAVAVLTPLALFEILAASGSAGITYKRFRAAKDDLRDLLERPMPERLNVASGSLELDSFDSLAISGSVRFENRTVRLPDLDVNKGDFIAITGASGVGKSTLAYVLTSLISQDSGNFYINSQPASIFNLESRHRLIALCEQQPQLFPGSIRQNLDISGQTAVETQAELLAQLGLLGEIEARGGLELELGEKGSGLSGGQMQRLSIARALLAGAQVLVLDEPTSGLDWANSERLMALLRFLSQKGLTIILITHDPQLAAMADRELALN